MDGHIELGMTEGLALLYVVIAKNFLCIRNPCFYYCVGEKMFLGTIRWVSKLQILTLI